MKRLTVRGGPSGPPRTPFGSEPDYRVWDVYHSAVCISALIITSVDHSIPGGRRVAAAILLAALAGWYVAVGRRLMLSRAAGTPAAWLYLAGVFALYVPAAYLCPSSTWVLFSLCVQAFFLQSHAVGTGLVGLLMSLPVLADWIGPDPSSSRLWTDLWKGLAITTATGLVSIWMGQIAEQNEARARLIAELEQSRAEVARLSHEAGMSAERTRLSAEIHDTLAQGFTSILTLVQAITAELSRDPSRAREHLDLAARTARENLAEARAMVASLAPSALATATLVEALERQTGRLVAEAGIAASFTCDGDPGAIERPVEVVLLRSAQEALTNVRKHSGARSVAVRLAGTSSSVRLSVTDDGRGFAVDAGGSGFGLRGMRTRVEQAGGTLSVRSTPGAGATIEVEVPR